MVMCQLATDTPLVGSEMQEVHRDSPGLFPDWDRETPPYQLAVNFPLVDVIAENGPTEIARGTHLLSKADAQARLARGEAVLEPVLMQLGDVMIRDVRHLHRGTPNRTPEPRPMVVVGFSRKWLRRPEVSVRVPQSTWEMLSSAQRGLLRFEPVVPDAQAAARQSTGISSIAAATSVGPRSMPWSSLDRTVRSARGSPASPSAGPR